jgi:hypothetical protein
MPAPDLFKYGDNADTWGGTQYRNYLTLPDRSQRIRSATAAWRDLLRGKAWIGFDPIAGRGRKARLHGGD